MKIKAAGLALCTVLVGCGGGDAPFGQDAVGGSNTDDTIDSDRTLPPGTTSPQSDETIFRKESQEGSTGNGFAEGVRYDSSNDTFFVDNLPFDGTDGEPYTRGTAVGSLGPYAVYEAPSVVEDSQTSQTIAQFRHRAIYGVSTSGQTEFAIVRTGDYVGYGFGGFVYERNGSVTLPTSGQARYDGSGAGLRDYDGRGGLEYTTSSVQIAIDFDDFNADTGRYGGAVDGFLFDRRIFDLDGNEITTDVLARINEGSSSSLTAIPTAVFTISTNALDTNGEITGTLSSRFANDAGQAVEYEAGNYYGIISGDNAEELVGVMVLTSSVDPSAEAVRETTGFTIYRSE